jgi:hypothetical protein
MKFSRSDFEMQRFESRRPNQPVRLKRVKYEKVRSKTAPYREISPRTAVLRQPLPEGTEPDAPRGTARFRRYERVSVCGIWQWKCHFGPLSPAAIFGVSFSRNVEVAPRRSDRQRESRR